MIPESDPRVREALRHEIEEWPLSVAQFNIVRDLLAEVVSLTARIEQLEQELEAAREAYRKQGQELFDQILLTEQAKARIAEGHG